MGKNLPVLYNFAEKLAFSCEKSGFHSHIFYIQKKVLCISKDLLNFVHGRLKIFHMYNSDMIFRKKGRFWPISTGFCTSERKKFVYVKYFTENDRAGTVPLKMGQPRLFCAIRLAGGRQTCINGDLRNLLRLPLCGIYSLSSGSFSRPFSQEKRFPQQGTSIRLVLPRFKTS